MRLPGIPTLWLVAVVAVGLGAACGPPSTFRPARTIPKGDVELILSAHGSLVGCHEAGAPVDDCLFSGTPGVAFRIGATDWMDLGIASDGLLSLRLEGTLQLLDTKRFALALSPAVGVQSLFPRIFGKNDDEPSVSFTTVLPLTVQWDLSSSVSWVVLGGPYHYRVAGEEGAWFPHLGTGLDLRLSSGFALRPSVSYTFQHGGRTGEVDVDPPTASASLGFVFH